MPFLHSFPCANPIICFQGDRKVRKLYDTREDRNFEAIYMFPSYLRCKSSIWLKSRYSIM